MAQSLEHYRAIEAEGRANGNGERIAFALRHIAEHQALRGQGVAAERDIAEALALYRADPAARRLDIANSLRVSALAAEASGKLDAAKQFWREAHVIYTELGVQAGVAEARAKSD